MNNKAELLLSYAELAPPGPFMEIGCIRTEGDEDDGQSTLHIAKFCHANNKSFISIDNNPEAVAVANSVLKKNRLPFEVVEGDGTEWIMSLARKISFLFLDSHKVPSFSYEQYKAAHLAKNAVLLIDDAQQIDGWPNGKADFVIQAFMKTGKQYEIVNTIPGYKMFVAIMKSEKKSGEL